MQKKMGVFLIKEKVARTTKHPSSFKNLVETVLIS